MVYISGWGSLALQQVEVPRKWAVKCHLCKKNFKRGEVGFDRIYPYKIYLAGWSTIPPNFNHTSHPSLHSFNLGLHLFSSERCAEVCSQCPVSFLSYFFFKKVKMQNSPSSFHDRQHLGKTFVANTNRNYPVFMRGAEQPMRTTKEGKCWSRPGACYGR